MRKVTATIVAAAALTVAGMGSAAAEYPSTGSFAVDEVNNGSSTLRQFPILAGSGQLITGSALAVLYPIGMISCAIGQLFDPKACTVVPSGDPNGPK
ncbi:hypothetical protein [Nocardia sp. NPDC057668]|uniref:hypothetical protein n=1 Tax=Nocardia sp. NPDC057668 TaxID=3346202 RepID=UPI00366BB8C5